MKSILSILGITTLVLGSVFGAMRYQDVRLQNESTEAQTERLTKELWKLQNQFGLTKYEAMVHASRTSDMHDCGCLGSTELGVGVPNILIMRTQDMPASIPQEDRIAFQNEVLQHEVMHIVLTEVEVPQDFQDKLIHRLQPSMVKP
jgi:hypothetical protein